MIHNYPDMKRNQTLMRFVSVLIVMIFFADCGNQDDPVVAEFGGMRIRLEDFNIAYIELLKKPNVMDSPELRENFLNEMINQWLLAAQARQLGLQNDEKFRYKVDAYRDKCLREAHYQEVIRPKVRVNDAQLKEVYSFLMQQRHVKHLYFRTLQEADSCYKLLTEGKSWDATASVIFSDSLLAQTGGDLGWIQWDQLEYELAQAAFRLDLNAISKPIKSSYGFHILKLVDYRLDPLISQQEYEQRRRKVKFILEKKIGDKLAAEYIADMMAGKRIEVRTDMLNLVSQKFSNLFPRDLSTDDQIFEVQLSSKEIASLEENFWDYREQALVIIDGLELSVGEFIYQLNYIPYFAIRQGFKTALDFVIRDRVLTDEARLMKLDRKYPEVVRKTNIFENILLQTRLRKDIVQNISVSEEEIEERYQQKKGALFKNSTLSEVSDTIHEMLMQEKRSSEISDLIQKLRDRVKIKTDYRAIHNYYDNILLTNKM